MEKQTEKGNTVKWLRRVLLCVAAAVMITAVLGMALFLMDPYGLKILPGVSVDGLDVGSLFPWEAKKVLEQKAGETLLGKDLILELPEETRAFSPSQRNVTLDVPKLVWDVFCYGRRGTAEEKETARQTGYDFCLGPYVSCDSAPIRSWLEQYAARWDTALIQPTWKLEGTAPELGTGVWDPSTPGQTLTITLGIPESHLDIEGILEKTKAVYNNGFSSEYTIIPAVLPEELPDQPDLNAIYQQICTEAVDDSLDMESFQLVHGSYGCTFDRKQAESLLKQAAFGETVSVSMEFIQPEILGEEVYFQDVLGTCETRHNDNANRNTNLQLLCQFLDGYVVQPGEEFSYNAAVGERTAERGFKPAPAYSGNRLVQDYGGGVCQGSTTLYNCLLLGDMEILERNCHGAAVGYVAKGLDAAVNWATKTDLRFRNNSHFPVKIQAEVADGYVKMKLLGTDEKDYTIKMESASWEDEIVTYGVSYKCKIDKKTGEQISREVEARSTYYKNLG